MKSAIAALFHPIAFIQDFMLTQLILLGFRMAMIVNLVIPVDDERTVRLAWQQKLT